MDTHERKWNKTTLKKYNLDFSHLKRRTNAELKQILNKRMPRIKRI